ncbi:MAG: RagB/SusD family nutrient uptake outer membrane protein [Chitinophagaceae bacterium]
MKRILYILAFFSLLQTSCTKFLQSEPYNNISVDDIFKDFEGARTTVIGLYDNLRSTEYYMRLLSIYPELTGGNAIYTRSNNVILFDAYNFKNDFINNDMRPFYEQAYATIFAANTVLDNIDKAANASVLQKNRLKADALCFRALAHFDLVKTFAQPYGFTDDASHQGVVLKLVNTNPLTPRSPRATVKQVYDAINADLDSAIQLYANSTFVYAFGDAKSYFSANAAKALKLRVALYSNNWNSVISLASEIIASNEYALVSRSSYINAWRGKAIHPESIFELNYGNRIAESLGTFYNPLVVNSGGYIAVTADLQNLFEPGDIRGSNGMLYTMVKDGNLHNFSRKYVGINDTANNVKLLRMSEVWLSRAEAYAQINNFTAALSDLNRVKQRAFVSYVPFQTNDKQLLLNEIFNERRRELNLEGHLLYDIARTKRNVIRNNCLSTICSFNYPNNNFACPIPLN